MPTLRAEDAMHEVADIGVGHGSLLLNRPLHGLRFCFRLDPTDKSVGYYHSSALGGLIESLLRRRFWQSPLRRPVNRCEPPARLKCFRAARVAVNYLLPAFAVVTESFFPGVKDESDPLTVVAIETVEIQEVAEYR